MTIDEFYNYIDAFSDRTNVPVRIMAQTHNPEQVYGCAHVIEYNPARMNEISSTGIIDVDKSLEVSNMIVVNRWFINERLESTSMEQLEALILHEYGHVKTLHMFSEDEQIEYWFKSRIIDLMFIMFSEGNDAYYPSIFMTLYNHLPQEKAANDAGGVDMNILLSLSDLVYMDIDDPECYPYRNLLTFHFDHKDKQLMHKLYHMYYSGNWDKSNMSRGWLAGHGYLKRKICKKFLPEIFHQYL